MIKRQSGFSLVELMITMVVFVFVIAAASSVFTGLLTQFKQQSKVAETNVEGIVGLEILRQDIESGGYGLPWDLNGAGYQEAVVESLTPWVDRDFNDGPPDNPARDTDPAGASNPPGGFRSGNGVALNGSDVLVIKAINIARNDTCEKWTTLSASPSFSDPYNPRQWTPASENLSSNDRVIVISPGGSGGQRVLVVNGTSFSTTFSNVITSPWPPTGPVETRIVYGVDPDTDLRMPFNRADYYVRIPTVMPGRCAQGTGIFYKATINQADGHLSELPLLDCVADMQVVYRRDTDSDGTIDNVTDDISTLTAQQIRDQIKEVRVYILAQEGQRDPNFTFQPPVSPSSITVGEFGFGRNFDLSTITNWQNYRWKLYTIVVAPKNLE